MVFFKESYQEKWTKINIMKNLKENIFQYIICIEKDEKRN
jgi:hypothetical protein